MKILHVLDHSLPLHSGYSFRSQNIFREQRKRGWQPVVVTSPKHEQSWKQLGRREEVINGFKYYRTGFTPVSKWSFIAELRLMYALMRRIGDAARIEKPKIIHAHSPILNAIPALIVSRRLKLPVAYEIRAFWEDAAVDHGTYLENSLKYRLVRSLETWVCRKADHVGVLCNGLKKDLTQRGIPSDKISVVYNGVNAADFSTSEPDTEFVRAWETNGKKVIGFIGSFYRYEGLDLLVHAFSLVSARKPNVVLLLVGDGEMENELKKQIKLLNLADRVIMPGRIPHGRISGVYALMDVLAYPRRSMRLTDLVTPLKPLEAMAMGKAVVASDVGGHQELIRNNETGLFFPAGDFLALAEKLLQLLDGDALRQRLQSRGVAWVKEHRTWEKTTSVYQGVYSRALDGCADS